jgi:hypothetical protein
MASATAFAVSTAKRMRRSGLPPQASVRWLEFGARNWWIR